MAETKNEDYAQRLGTLQKMGVSTMDRTLALYAGFLLGLLAKPPVVLAVLALLSLRVFAQKTGQAQRYECPKAAVT